MSTGLPVTETAAGPPAATPFAGPGRAIFAGAVARGRDPRARKGAGMTRFIASRH